MIDKSILKLCMKVNGLMSFYPQFNELDNKVIEPTPDMIGKYGWNNEIVAFVTSDGSYYVTPYCAEVTEYLNKNNYTNGYIYVPFSNQDEPAERLIAQEWKKMCIDAKSLHSKKEMERKTEEIHRYARNKSIKKLSNEVYECSLEIPSKGFEVSYYDNEYSMVRPIPNFDLINHIGTYWNNNGKLVFVDDKGKTYVTPYYHNISIKLKEAGYFPNRMFVPLSNGEEILDENLKNRWHKLCYEANEDTKRRINVERRTELQELANEKGIKQLPIDVYKLSFFIPTTGVETSWYEEKKETTYPINEWSLKVYLGSYFQNNGKLVFVDDKGDTFVTPFANEITATLRDAGYRERSMYVPFSNGDIPSDRMLALRWKHLCYLARRAYKTREEERRYNKIISLAKKKGVAELPHEVYMLSLEIPKNGFETIFYGTEKDITRPVYEWELDYALGTYCENNGKLVFVDKYGGTFVTPYVEEVKDTLVDRGFNPASLFVPLSNGEKIVNEDIAKKWEQLCSRIDDK